MLAPYRQDFNNTFTEARYQDLLENLALKTRTSLKFRISETPCFFSAELMELLAGTGKELTLQLLENSAYMEISARAIPRRFVVANQDAHPQFMTVDFGLVRGADGAIQPKLVEMQAFPSIFGFQELLGRQYAESFNLGDGFQFLLGGMDRTTYWKELAKVILGGHDPENVVLADIAPHHQKTLPDFRVYEDELGISTVDIAAIRKVGNRLYYEKKGRELPIRRIFNRAIVDEMERSGTQLQFDLRDDLDVEWAGHPNWFFRISKLSLPYLNHGAVPRAQFLDEWLRQPVLTQDRTKLLLKPLYSFAGQGIRFSPSEEEIMAIPEGDRNGYLIQERVNFAPIIDTPEGMTQAEVRIMYLWPTGGSLLPAISLVRMGRGLMMGVDHNKHAGWVGGSAALVPSN